MHLLKTILHKIQSIHPWHFLWISVISSELITPAISFVVSQLLWQYTPREVLIVGSIDSLFVPLIVVPMIIIFVAQISRLKQELESRKEAEKEIRYLAYYDNLTNLPNRTLFKELLERAIATASRHNYVMAILFIDLDFFKRINDTLGHDIGDKLLKAVRDRLLNSTRSSDFMSRSDENEQKDVVSRLGGDEFILLLHNLASLHDPGRVAMRIIKDMSKPFNVEGHEVYITASIGISIYPDDGGNVEDMIKNADVAMYHAKAKGRNNYQYYSQDLTSVELKYLTMENKLRRALDNNEFLLYYQPKHSVADGSIMGLEALLRWKPDDSDLVPPSQFISILEEGGLIMPVGDWVLRTACLQNRAWQDAGYGPTIVSVNLSSRQFDQKDLIDIVTNALQEAGLHPRYLELEITESTVMKDPEAAIITLNRLKGMGVQISIDDFGTGYSSLTYLKRIPLDFIKIDRSFIEQVLVNPSDQAIVKSVIALAHSLNLRVIAEGVETEEQLIFLRGCDCDHVQGYLLNRPLPAHQAGQLFTSAEPGCAVS